MGRKKYEEGSEQLMIICESTQHHMWNMMDHCDGMSMASSGTGLLVFSDDVTEDRSSWINSEVYQDILSAQIQLHATTFIGRCFIIQMDNGPKHYSKSNPGVFEGKKVYYSAMAESISCSQPDWACISLAEDKTQGGKTHKQTTTEVSCSKGLAKHHKGLGWCLWVPD